MGNQRDTAHRWTFYRAGGLDQVLLRSGADIASIRLLDQKLWTALSCPVKGIRFDARTLDLLDADGDGRIRAPELLAALEWVNARLNTLDSLFAGSESLPLIALNAASPEGRVLLVNAKRILANLGKTDADALSLSDVADTSKIFAQTRFNGDGIIPGAAADDAATQQVIAEIIATQGAETDRSGKPGVNQAKTDAFFSSAEAFLDWHRRANAVVLPLGEQTAAALGALTPVRAKIDDYFTRCRLAAFDVRATGPLNRTDGDFAALADHDLSDGQPELAVFPLSRIAAGRDLPLTDGLNPYWVRAMAAFRDAVVTPVLGVACDTLASAQWQTLTALFAPYEAWVTAQAGASVAGLGVARIEAILAGDARERVTALIAQDAALAPENARIAELECLVRYHANLIVLLQNFVNMRCLYNPEVFAIFQVGTLYMDARACTLCFHVDDIGVHSAQAAASKCCLAYCALSRPGTRETRLICAAFTAGFAQTLWVGRNGLFYDRDGRDWDATIVKMVDNAISLKEAFWDPWRKIATMIGDQIKKMLASKHDAALSGAARKIETTGVTSPAEAPRKMEGAALASSVAALGIAVGLVGSAIGGLVGVLAGLPPWKTALGLVTVLLLVSGPAVILTWFKLRARDVAPILNASGWAVNRRLRLSLKLGRLFTAEAALPANAACQLTDPYADDKTVRNRIIAILLLAVLTAALWLAGLLDSALPDTLKKNAPCTPAAAVAFRAIGAADKQTRGITKII